MSILVDKNTQLLVLAALHGANVCAGIIPGNARGQASVGFPQNLEQLAAVAPAQKIPELAAKDRNNGAGNER
jgi:hypothetical protein